MPQTEAMKQAGVAIDYVLEVDLPFDEIIVRINGRRVDAASGRTYHVNFNRGFLVMEELAVCPGSCLRHEVSAIQPRSSAGIAQQKPD